MNVHYVGSQISHLRNPFLRLHNHQVHIKGFVQTSATASITGKLNEMLGNKHTVHHIEVEHVCLGIVDYLYVFC